MNNDKNIVDAIRGLRVMFILDTFGGGGKEHRCLQLIQGLNNLNICNIRLIILDAEIDYPEIFATSAEVSILDRKHLKLSYWRTYQEIKNQVNMFAPDIVQGWGFMSLFFLNILRLRKKFIYVASHVANVNEPKGKEKIINTLANYFADAIVGNSVNGLRAYSVPPTKAYCIYNGYNSQRRELLTDSEMLMLRQELSVSTPYVVMMVARVDKNKDYDCFVRIAKTICALRDDITFLAVGKGPLLDIFQAETINDKRIKFLGFRNDVDKLLKLTTVSVLCTNFRHHKEGVSNSILESMANGVPVVATFGGGTSEIIIDGESGFCIKDNKEDSFVEKILFLINNKEIYNNFSKKCIQIVSDKFSLEGATMKYVELYCNLLLKR